jgi:rubrerythrin
MTKYIKANGLTDKVIESMNYNPHNNNLQRQNHIAEHRHFITMIDSMKAEEVMPVRYGHWDTDRFGMERAICSVCRAVFEGGDSWNYCPKCGAKMVTPITLRLDRPED